MAIDILLRSKLDARGLNEAQQHIQGLLKTVKDANNFIPDRTIDSYLGIDSASARNAVLEKAKSLQTLAQNLRNAGSAAVEAGNNVAGMGLLQRARDADSLAKSFMELAGEGEKVGGITEIMNSKFNQFGFTLFVTMSTLKQVKDILVGVFETAQEGAAALDKLTAFESLTALEGIDTSRLTANLKEAAQGVVTFETATQNTLRLLKGGFPEIAAESDAILEIAVNAAKVSGELENVELIYDKLIRGIIRGSPRLIDDADIVLKLGDAYEEYAASLGKSSDQLTRAEQVQATFNAVITEGERINELAEGIDSTALVLQQFKTDVSEAATEAKIFLATLTAESLTGTKEVLEGIADQLLENAGLSAEAAEKFREVITTLKGFTGAAISGFAAFAAGLGELIRGVEKIRQEFNEFFMATIGGFRALAIAVRDPLQGFEEMSAILKNIGSEGLDVLLQPLENVTDVSNAVKDTMFEWMSTFDLVPGATQSVQQLAGALEEVDSVQSGLSNQFAGLKAQIEDAFDPLSDMNIARELNSKRQDIEMDHADKMVDINEGLADKLIDINENLNDKLLDIANKRAEGIQDARETLADALNDISRDLNDKLSDITSDAQDKTEGLHKKHADKIKEIERGKYQALLDAQREFEAARLSALIDRDARALFEAEENRKRELQKIDEKAKEERKKENEAFKSELEEIKKQEEKKRKEAIEAADRRRKDAQEAYAKKLKDLEEAFQKERQKAIQAAEQQRRDAKEAAEKQRRDALQSYQDRLNDLSQWHEEQLRRQKEAALREKLALLQKFADEQQLTADHLNELQDLYDQYNQLQTGDIDLGDSPLPITGSGGTPGIGPNAPQPGDPLLDPNEIIPGTVIGTGGDTGIAVGGRQVSGRLTIESSNDSLLAQILKETAAEAYIEINQD